MPCSCQKNKSQYEVVDASGKRVFGPTPYKTTADARRSRGSFSKESPMASKTVLAPACHRSGVYGLRRDNALM